MHLLLKIGRARGELILCCSRYLLYAILTIKAGSKIPKKRSVMLHPILLVIGSHRESIKLLPVYLACLSENLPVAIAASSQNDTLLRATFDLFNITPDFDIGMLPLHNLFTTTQMVLEHMHTILTNIQPSLVMVQGDTTTAMAASLAAFYHRTPIAHIEAGLRTNDLSSPFPEEMNRRFMSLIASYHFTPTAATAAHVLAQGVHRDAVFCVGNTIVDALRILQSKIGAGQIAVDEKIQRIITNAQHKGHTVALLTMHRHMTYPEGLERVLQSIKQALQKHNNLTVIYMYQYNHDAYGNSEHVHIQNTIERSHLKQCDRMHFYESISYPDIVYALSASDWIMTDSDELQEAATSLGKPSLILRDKTERMESVWAGISSVVGTDVHKILHGITMLINDIPLTTKYRELYGDGHAAEKILTILLQKFTHVFDVATEHKRVD